jgi:23S rRNA (guanosine2251-2'-O)-methyltransferase
VIVYGRNPVREALRGTRAVSRIWATGSVLRQPWLATAAVSRVDVDTAAAIARRCGSNAHQGICAEVGEFRYADPAELLAGEEPLLVALDQVQDPQNLGAVCRTAESAGAAGVILPARRTAAITAAVCKASAGAVEHLPVARVRNLADWLGMVKRRGLWCYGAAAGAELDYLSVDFSGGVVLVLGSEGNGLRPRVAAACDALVAVPQRGRIESLSVSAAAAVLLFAASKSRA